jgi:hypothetical protein
MNEIILENARREAYTQAKQKNDETVRQLLDNNIVGVTQLGRQKIPKEYMKISKYFHCDGCSQPIYKPEDGCIFQGNVYTANPDNRGGLIGTKIRQNADGMIHISDLPELVLCKTCVMQTLFKSDKKMKITRNTTATSPSYDKMLYDTMIEEISGSEPEEIPF